MPGIALPFEQLEQILASHNTAHGQRSLVAASSVSKEWRSAAQTHLYGIAWIQSARRFELFIQVISQDARLRSYVKEVRLNGGTENSIDSLEASEERPVPDCSRLIKQIFALCPEIKFASFTGMLGVMGSLSQNIESIDTDEYFSAGTGSGLEPSPGVAAKIDLQYPKIKRMTIRNGDLNEMNGRLTIIRTLNLFPNLSSLRLIDCLFPPSSLPFASLLAPLSHIVLHGLANPQTALLSVLVSLVTLTIPILFLDSSVTESQPSPLQLIPSSSLVTLRLLRPADSTPPTPNEAIDLCYNVAQHIGCSKTLKKVCVDWSYWSGRKMLCDLCEKRKVRLVWGIFVTGDEEWNRTEWGARLPEYDLV